MNKLRLSSKIFIYLFLAPFFVYTFFLFRQRITSFGCFDDCATYTVGYFLAKGQVLYTQVPFNHQPLPLYLSAILQKVFQPQHLYELLLVHRLFLFAFSLGMGVLILLRFRLVGVAFVIFYESTKFFLFGERFLPESFIVYPLVYALGLVWLKWAGERIYKIEYLLIGVFTWFVVFSRLPYIPLALALYVFLLWGRGLKNAKILSLFLFTLLSAATLLTTSLPAYFFNLVTVNTASVVTTEVKGNLLTGGGIFKSFFYPFFLFFGGEWNIFRVFLVFLNIAFLKLLWLTVIKPRKAKLALFLFLLLGLANIRVVPPGTIFYEAFHMIQWYGLFLMATFLMLAALYRTRKYLSFFFTVFIFAALAFLLFHPESYLWEKVDRQEELVTGYGPYLATSQIINILAGRQDTLFLDNNREDLIYFLTDLSSPYKYSWYTWLMPSFPRYDRARLEMFAKNPPDFYYGHCSSGAVSVQTLPEDRVGNYIQLFFAGRPTCLYIHKDKVKEIPPRKWEEAHGLQYNLN